MGLKVASGLDDSAVDVIDNSLYLPEMSTSAGTYYPHSNYLLHAWAESSYHQLDFHRYEYLWTNNYTLYFDDKSIGTITTSVPTSAMGVTFGGDRTKLQCDYVFVTKYVPNEPRNGPWGQANKQISFANQVVNKIH